MVQRFTIIFLLIAITVQAAFGGLQDTVSICLGGGHEHEVEEVVEHCEIECNHHSDWPTPVSTTQDIEDCECTDLELSLIMLLWVPRENDEISPPVVALFPLSTVIVPESEYPSNIIESPPRVRHQLILVRTTRLLI
jgi:hypothetical protein